MGSHTGDSQGTGSDPRLRAAIPLGCRLLSGPSLWQAGKAPGSSWLSPEVGEQSTPSCQAGPGPCSSVGMNSGEGHHTPSPFKVECAQALTQLWAQSELVSKGWCRREGPQPTQSLQGVWCWMQPLGCSNGCKGVAS